MTDLIALAEKVEAATEGSRELDAEVATALGWEGIETAPLPTYTSHPYDLTASVEALPEGCFWDVCSEGEACVTLPGNGFLSDRGDYECFGRASWPSGSMTAAMLRAVHASQNG